MFVSSSKNTDTHAFVAKFANRNFRFRDFLGGSEFFLFGEGAGGGVGCGAVFQKI